MQKDIFLIISLPIVVIFIGALLKKRVLIEGVFIISFLPFLRLSAWGSGFSGLESVDTVSIAKIIIRIGTFSILLSYLALRIHRLIDLVKGDNLIIINFYFLGLLSLAYSSDRFYSGFRLVEHVGYLLFALAILIKQFPTVNTHKAINLVLYSCGMLVTIVWLTYFWNPNYAFRMLHGTLATFGGHILHIHTLGIIAAMIYGVIFFRLLCRKKFLTTLSIFHILVVFLMFLTVILTRSRTSLIILVIVTMVIVWRTYPYRIGSICLVLALLYLLTVDQSVIDQFVSYFLRDDSVENLRTMSSRTRIWEEVIAQTWEESPLLGYGYQMLSDKGIYFFSYEYGFERSNAHSTFVQTFAGLGIIGLLLLVWHITVIARTLVVLSFKREGSHQDDFFELLILYICCIIASITEFGIVGMTTPVVPVYLIISVYCTYWAKRTIMPSMEQFSTLPHKIYLKGRHDF